MTLALNSIIPKDLCSNGYTCDINDGLSFLDTQRTRSKCDLGSIPYIMVLLPTRKEQINSSVILAEAVLGQVPQLPFLPARQWSSTYEGSKATQRAKIRNNWGH
jgi:hypothetical protein